MRLRTILVVPVVEWFQPERSPGGRTFTSSAAWAAIALFAFMLPSSRFNLFSGIPLDGPIGVLAVLLLLPLVCSRAIRSLFGRRALKSWSTPTPRRSERGPSYYRDGLLGALPALMIGLKAGLLLLGRPEGFLAQYSSPLARPPVGDVERSWSEPWNGSITRRDRVLRFSPTDWNLSFFNSVRFNFSEGIPGLPSRNHLPFAVRWTGPVDLEPGTVLEVTYTGQGRVALGSETVELSPRYETGNPVRIRLTGPVSSLHAEFSFDDGYRTGRHVPPGPYAAFSIEIVMPDGTRIPISSHAGGFAEEAAAAVVDIAGGSLCLSLLWFFLGFAWLEWRWTAPFVTLVAAVTAFGFGHVPAALAGAGYAMLFPAYLSVVVGVRQQPRRRRVLVAWLAILVLALSSASAVLPGFSTVRYRGGGTDWLTYESFARSILETGSMTGGESVFYYQPAYRYIRYLMRLLLGDGEGAILVVSLAALWFAPIVLVATTRRRSGLISWVATVSLAALVWAPDVFACVLDGVSEYPTWIALPVAYAFLWSPGSRGRALAGTLLAAGSAVTRVNQLPGWIGTVSGALHGRRHLELRWKIVANFLFLALLSLPLLHNLLYGHRAVLFTTSGGISDNLVLPVQEWMRFFDDAGVRGRCLDQVRHTFFFWNRTFLRSTVSRTAVHVCQLSWICCGVLVFRRRPFPHTSLWVLWVSPLLFLAPHLLYQVLDYYPRHVLAGHMAMASAVILILGRPAEGREHGS